MFFAGGIVGDSVRSTSPTSLDDRLENKAAPTITNSTSAASSPRRIRFRILID
jgi:hypothetical protein